MSKPTWTYTGPDASRDGAATMGPKLVTLTNRLYDYEIYPEDYDAVGDGIEDDDAEINNYITQLNSGTNKSLGKSRKATYLVSTTKTITGTPRIDFPGVIKRTDDSEANPVVTLALGTAGLTEINLNVDGNSANANAVVGITLNSGNNNTKSKHILSAIECDTGIRIEGNVEKLNVDAYVRNNLIGVNVHNDGSPNTVDELDLHITGASCDQFLLIDGDQKTSGAVHFNVEQSDNDTVYVVPVQNGWWKFSGEIRAVHGGFNISTTSALLVTFDEMTLVGRGDPGGSALEALVCSSGTCLISGTLIMPDWNNGAWIKNCAGGSSLAMRRRDSGATGTGLRIGDFANSTQVAGFTLNPSVLFGATNALHLDYATNCTFHIEQILEGGITISANSSGNTIRLGKSLRNKTITNNRTQNDNIIIYKGAFTNTELEEILSPFKGMFVEASSDTSVYGGLFWSGAAWESQDGKTYDAGTNLWS